MHAPPDIPQYDDDVFDDNDDDADDNDDNCEDIEDNVIEFVAIQMILLMLPQLMMAVIKMRIKLMMISHQMSQFSTSLLFLFHLVLAMVLGSSLRSVLGKHSTIWSTLAVFRCSLLNSLTVLYFSSFFIVTLKASLVFSSTSLSKSPPSPNTWSGGINLPFGASTCNKRNHYKVDVNILILPLYT